MNLKANGYGHFVMVITMKDRRALERFAKAISPYIGERRTYTNMKQIGVRAEFHQVSDKRYSEEQNRYWRVCVASGPAERVAEAMLPYLKGTDKGDQMIKALKAVCKNHKERPKPSVDTWSKKIKMKDAQAIRRRYSKGESQKSLSNRFGISQGNISLIVNNKTWKQK